MCVGEKGNCKPNEDVEMDWSYDKINVFQNIFQRMMMFR